MLSRWCVAVGSVIVLSAIAGCGTSVMGSAEPSGGNTPSSQDLHGAPHVEHPVGVSRFLNNPCGVLSRQQLAELKKSIPIATTGKYDSRFSFKKCGYVEEDGSVTGASTWSYTFLTNGTGLSTIYENDRSPYGYLRVIPPIAGQPAVIAGAGKDESKQGTCNVSVGLSDSLALGVNLSLDDTAGEPADFTNSCKPTIELATAVVKSLKGGS